MRSSWKFAYSNVFIDGMYLRAKKVALKRKRSNKRVKLVIFSRASTILSCFIGYRVLVHQGAKFTDFLIKDYMVGHKFGEYSFCKNIGAQIHEPKKKGKAKNIGVLKRK